MVELPEDQPYHNGPPPTPTSFEALPASLLSDCCPTCLEVVPWQDWNVCLSLVYPACVLIFRSKKEKLSMLVFTHCLNVCETSRLSQFRFNAAQLCRLCTAQLSTAQICTALHSTEQLCRLHCSSVFFRPGSSSIDNCKTLLEACLSWNMWLWPFPTPSPGQLVP